MICNSFCIKLNNQKPHPIDLSEKKKRIHLKILDKSQNSQESSGFQPRSRSLVTQNWPNAGSVTGLQPAPLVVMFQAMFTDFGWHYYCQWNSEYLLLCLLSPIPSKYAKGPLPSFPSHYNLLFWSLVEIGLSQECGIASGIE